MKQVSVSRLVFFAVVYIVLYLALVFSVYHAEVDNDGSNIKSMGEALWFSIVTLTTVGYGDYYPVTTGGRIVGLVFILLSLGFYAILIGQIANVMSTIQENKRLGLYGTKFKKHVVIIGWTEFGKAVTDQLLAAGRQVCIVTKERDSVDLIYELYNTKKVFVLYTDYNNLEMLDKANIEDSSIVFVNLNDDTEKLVYILNLKKHHEHLKYVVTLDNSNLKQTFRSAGVTYVVTKHEISSKLLASYIFEPDVALFSEELISFPENEDHYDIKQYRILDNNPFVGQHYDKVFFDLKKQYNVVLIGMVKNQNGTRKMLKNPEDSVVIEKNDYLIMMMNQKSMKNLSEFFKSDEGVTIA